jgi:Tol biopolymer transport system component/DNA-binding winged helix-turn-helix (wHTH) protein
MGNPAPLVGKTNSGDASSTRRFGVFELDLRAGELRRHGIKVKLQEQPFQVLAELVERPGQVVTREQLRHRLWPANTYVDFDHSLNAAIRRLRDALGDSAENPTFVETVARRGYRFLAPVSGVPQDGSALTEAQAESLSLSPSPPTSKPRFRHRWLVALVSAVGLVVIGLAIGFLIAPRSPVLDRTTRLTANPAGDPIRAAAISRDGRHLAFSDHTGFYLRQIDSGETHPVALPDGVIVTSISWSPDIDHLVVGLAGTNHFTSLWEVSVLGGKARKLVDEGSQPSISPNGKQIAFLVGQPLHQRIWLAGMLGEPPRELLGEDGDFFGSISWSPDGRKIAYTTTRFTYGYGTKGMIAVADVSHASSGARPTTVLSVAGLEAAMVWAPDGRLIYTVDERRPRQEDSNLWSIRLNSQTRSEGAPVRLTNDEGSVFSVSVSADGKRMVYVKGVPQPDVYVAKLGASGNLEEPERLTLDDRRDLPYDWTADNKAVIFASDRTGTFSLYKQGIDQTMPEMLVSASQQVMGPRLTPDGTHILYMLNPHWEDSNFEVPLMSVPLGGGPARELAKAKWITNVQCARAPARACLYSVLTDSGVTFFQFDSSRGGGTPFLQIKDEFGHAYNWSLSPDGKTLAIAKGKWGNDEPRIRLVSLDGAPDRWLVIHGWSAIASIDWSADSKNLWAATAGERENVLLGIDLQGNARVVWRPKNLIVGWAIPSRDGKLLALHVRSSSANAWMLEH